MLFGRDAKLSHTPFRPFFSEWVYVTRTSPDSSISNTLLILTVHSGVTSSRRVVKVEKGGVMTSSCVCVCERERLREMRERERK